MTNTTVPQTDWSAAGRKAWATQAARRAIPDFAERLETLIQRRDCYRMIIEDSGITSQTHRIMDQAVNAGSNIDAICDLIYENAPFATALSRCDGSPAEVLDIIDTDDRNRRELQNVRRQIRALLQAHL